jgi:GR25 family glycosyltransferase involved in LPS biosynthesis|tara:strand:+ start:368 stop:1237 length:870 start_codon:yes stop_codon:yes gene_type:complete
MNKNYTNLKTIVINLDDYIDNHKKQLPYLEKIGLNTERFLAINAIKGEHLNPLYEKYISKFALNFQPKAVIGCALSHILCAKYIYESYINDYEYFLIMEDDAFPVYDKEEFYNLLNKNLKEIEVLDKNWDIIQLHSDAFFPTNDTYATHYICGSTAAYLISRRGIEKTLDRKVYSHADFIQHNFLKFNKYRVKSNLFWTDEKNSVNRFVSCKNYSFYNLSLYTKTMLVEFINKFILSLPLRGEKTYSNFFEFKIIKLPFLQKEYTANEVIDYILGFILMKKLKHKISQK